MQLLFMSYWPLPVAASCPAVTNAARTNLMELSSLSWHSATLELFGAPAAMMPRIASNAEVYGHVAAGPLAGVPISGGN
jgi:glycerol kinase